MSRYTKSSYRKSRRLGFSTLETGRELAKKPYAPGIHGQKSLGDTDGRLYAPVCGERGLLRDAGKQASQGDRPFLCVRLQYLPGGRHRRLLFHAVQKPAAEVQ